MARGERGAGSAGLYTEAVSGFNQNIPEVGGVELLKGVCSCLLSVERQAPRKRGPAAREPHEWRHGDLPARRPPYFDHPVELREVVRRKTFALHAHVTAKGPVSANATRALTAGASRRR